MRVKLKRWWLLQRGNSGDGCALASTLCKYDLRMEVYLLSWARVPRVMRGSIYSELLMCGGGMLSILLLPLVARRLIVFAVVVCLPRPMEGRGRLQFSYIFTELPVPPQAA